MKNRTIINCETCGSNQLATIVFQNYEIGKIFEQKIQCCKCKAVTILKIDLTQKKEET